MKVVQLMGKGQLVDRCVVSSTRVFLLESFHSPAGPNPKPARESFARIMESAFLKRMRNNYTVKDILNGLLNKQYYYNKKRKRCVNLVQSNFNPINFFLCRKAAYCVERLNGHLEACSSEVLQKVHTAS
jgi:hypothetical protein